MDTENILLIQQMLSDFNFVYLEIKFLEQDMVYPLHKTNIPQKAYSF